MPRDFKMYAPGELDRLEVLLMGEGEDLIRQVTGAASICKAAAATYEGDAMELERLRSEFEVSDKLLKSTSPLSGDAFAAVTARRHELQIQVSAMEVRAASSKEALEKREQHLSIADDFLNKLLAGWHHLYAQRISERMTGLVLDFVEAFSAARCDLREETLAARNSVNLISSELRPQFQIPPPYTFWNNEVGHDLDPLAAAARGLGLLRERERLRLTSGDN